MNTQFEHSAETISAMTEFNEAICEAISCLNDIKINLDEIKVCDLKEKIVNLHKFFFKSNEDRLMKILERVYDEYTYSLEQRQEK